MKRQKIGEVGVDAGMIYVGDPCYIGKTDLGRTDDKAWEDFLTGIAGSKGYLESHATVVGALPNGSPFDAGVVVVSGHGDGVYPVFAEFASDGSIARITVEFSND
jgi:hypothetical protein